MSQIKPYKHCEKCGAWIVSGDLCEDCKPMPAIDSGYAVYTVMKTIIIDTYEQTMKFNSGQIREFADYLNHDFDMDIENYVGCFVGCSHGCEATKKMLHDMIEAH